MTLRKLVVFKKKGRGGFMSMEKVISALEEIKNINIEYGISTYAISKL